MDKGGSRNVERVAIRNKELDWQEISWKLKRSQTVHSVRVVIVTWRMMYTTT